MNSRTLWIALLAAGLAVAAYAGLRGGSGPVPEPVAADPQASATQNDLPPGHPAIGAAGPAGAASDLPPGHPQLGQGTAPPLDSSGNLAAAPAGDHGAGLDWTVPSRWHTAPNPTSMRLATFKIPHQSPDTEDAEMSVTRVGGSSSANIERWIGQFDEPGQKSAKRTERTTAGFKTTIVEVQGTYAGGGMMGAPSAPKSGWALVGVIVETPGTGHFFKLTGPAATVKAARPEIDAFLSSMKPKK
jgi:hypothetical protein